MILGELFIFHKLFRNGLLFAKRERNFMKSKRLILALILAAALGCILAQHGLADDEFTAELKRYPYRSDLTVIGNPSFYKIPPKEDLLEIARRFGLGYNEVDLLFPKMDPWILPRGKRIMIPTFWVLPPSKLEQLVINVPELRIYFFEKKNSTVQTYPIGIGDEGWETPLGTFHINDKRTNPTWYIPASLQEKYGMAQMPPGPDNPLGEFVMKFSAGAYGIHGTHMPWGVGRLVSHGCIRCYPEHIRLLYPHVPIGTKLEIIYEPVKIGQKGDQVFVEAHPDVYQKIPDYLQYALDKLAKHPMAQQIDRKRFMNAVHLQNGVPTNVTNLASEGTSLNLVEAMQQ